jgi:GH24 family phage-related lysozyme (muramidase)
MSVQLSDDGAAFIAREEGAVPYWYKDALGFWTLGIGHLRVADEFSDVAQRRADGTFTAGRRLTDAEMWDLFRTDAARFVEAVDRLVTVDLIQRQFDMLVDFAFNWGIGALGGFPATSILRLVNDRDWAGVARELVDGIGPRTPSYPDGRRYDKGLPGVRVRRQREAEAFLVAPMTPVEIIRVVIADMKAWGDPVALVPGWETRGRPYRFAPRGAVDHHTASRGYANDYPSLGIVRDGRSDLPGPLSQFGIGRITGTLYVIAAGYANHAGGGGWNGLTGNGSVWGASEAENDGIGEPISPAQMRTRLHLHASLARHTGYGPASICCHREWSDGGKIDPTGVDGDWLRAEVTRLLANTPIPGPTPAPPVDPWADLFVPVLICD